MRRWAGVREDLKKAENLGVPYEIRTRVTAVKGRCPRPLDERDAQLGTSRGSEIVKLAERIWSVKRTVVTFRSVFAALALHSLRRTQSAVQSLFLRGNKP